MARKKKYLQGKQLLKVCFLWYWTNTIIVIHDQEIVSRGLSCAFSFDYKHFLLISFIFFLMKTGFEETY